MKRKFPRTVFVVLIILNLLNVLLWAIGGGLDLTVGIIVAIAGALLFGALCHLILGGLIYLILPAIIYFMLSKEDSKKNRTGYIMAIVALALQIIFIAPTWLIILLFCIEGGYYWISFIYYIIGAVLTIVAIIYSKKYLKLKASKRKES